MSTLFKLALTILFIFYILNNAKAGGTNHASGVTAGDPADCGWQVCIQHTDGPERQSTADPM